MICLESFHCIHCNFSRFKAPKNGLAPFQVYLVVSRNKMRADGHRWKQRGCAGHLEMKWQLTQNLKQILIFANHENCGGFCVFEVTGDAVVASPDGQNYL